MPLKSRIRFFGCQSSACTLSSREVVSTYQSASGAGRAAMEELQSQTKDVLEGRGIAEGAAAPKVMAETRKILADPDLAITATCVRVPVLRAHTESINLSLKQPLSPERARTLLAEAAGVEIVDERERDRFPMPTIASGHDAVYVGRIRRDLSLARARKSAVILTP